MLDARVPATEAPPLPRDAGVTLIEILVVLALIGVLASSVSLGFGSLGRDDRLAHSAELLAARLQTVADGAIQSGTDAALVWDKRSYGFATPDGEGWQAAGAGFPPLHELPEGVSIEVEGFDNARVIRGDALPAEEPFVLTIRDGVTLARVAFDGLTARAITGVEAQE